MNAAEELTFSTYQAASESADQAVVPGTLLTFPMLSNHHTHGGQSAFGLGPSFEDRLFDQWLHHTVIEPQRRASRADQIRSVELCIIDNLLVGNHEVTLHEKGIVDPDLLVQLAGLLSRWEVPLHLRVGLYPDQLRDGHLLDELVATTREVAPTFETHSGSIGLGPVNIDATTVDLLSPLIERVGADNRWHGHLLERPEPSCVRRLLEVAEEDLSSWELVHCCAASKAELRQLAAAGAHLVACPTSNLFLGSNPPPLENLPSLGSFRLGSDGRASGGNQSVLMAAWHMWLIENQLRPPFGRFLDGLVDNREPGPGQGAAAQPQVSWSTRQDLPSLSSIVYSLAGEPSAFRLDRVRLTNGRVHTAKELHHLRHEVHRTSAPLVA